MQETPKREQPSADEQGEKRRSYYYDDSHGYEDYDADAEGREEDEKSDQTDPNHPLN